MKFQTHFATGRYIAPIDSDGDVVSLKADFAVSNAMVDSTGVVRTNFAVNDVIEMFDLPSSHVIDDIVLVSDDIDSNGAPTVAMSVGIIAAADNALDVSAANGSAAFIAASTVGQAGGAVRPTTQALWRLQPQESSSRRRVGILITAAPATIQAGTLSLVARLRSAHYGA